MHISSRVVVALLCALAASPVLPAAAQDHATHHATPPTTTPAKRWTSDAPLRKGMAEIRAAVDALEHDEHGHIGPEQAATLATAIENQVAYLVANCTLEPQADAVLHAIIGRLLRGTAALKADPQDKAGVAMLRQALQDYAQHFDDPGWTNTEAEEQ